MRECPKCRNWTLDFDQYFGRYRCLDPRCGWMPPSTAERTIRLLHRQPEEFESIEIPGLKLFLSPSYDRETDVFSVDFGIEEPTVDLPEADGRMMWRIGRRSGTVAGFSLVGICVESISQITIEFIARRKSDIERFFQKTPTGLAGRAKRGFAEEIVVTIGSEDEASRRYDPKLESEWEEKVVNRVKQLLTS